MTFNRVKHGSRPMRDYDAVPEVKSGDPTENANASAPAVGERAVQAALRNHEIMTAERITDANLIPKAITESEWGPGNAREIDQSHGPSL